MALQYARRMGFNVVAIGRGSDVRQDALDLGAHVYIDSNVEDAAAVLQAHGNAQAIVTTITNTAAVTALMKSMAPTDWS